MNSRVALENLPTSIIPIDPETHAMLEYAESAAGKEKIERARQEIRDGKSMEMTADYFAELNRRISERVKNSQRKEA